MDNIRKYLDNLFLGLPETPEVLRAKAELLQMMEDKYEELIAEGKTPEETFGIVVAEFGSLEEIAEDLGIAKHLHQNNASGSNQTENNDKPKQNWNLERTTAFFESMKKHALFVAAGVATFIMAPQLEDLLSCCFSYLMKPAIANIIATVIFFALIAFGVVLCVGAKQLFRNFQYDSKQKVALDLDSAKFVKEHRDKTDNKLYQMKVAGILLCIFSFVPNIIVDTVGIWDEITSTLFFAMVAAGVFCLVYSGSLNARYKELATADVYNTNENRLNAEYFVEPTPHKLSTGIKIIILVSIIAIVSIITVSNVIGLVTMKNKLFSDVSVNEQQLKTIQSADATSIQNISVDMDMQNIKLEPSTSDKIEIQYDGDSQYAPAVTCSNSTVTIKEQKKSRIRFIGITSKDAGTIVVKIPTSANAINYSFDLDAGNIELEKITGSKLNLDMDAGNSTLIDCTFKTTICDADAGNVNIENSSFESLRCDLDAGNIEFTPRESIYCYSCDLEASLGKISFGDESQGGTENRLRRDATDHSQGEHSFKASADMGNIIIKNTIS